MTYPIVQADGIPLWTKDPDEIITRGLNWSEYLSPEETIATAVWTVPAGIIGVQVDQFALKRTLIRLLGGTLNTTYSLACKITTSSGDAPQRSIRISVREK